MRVVILPLAVLLASPLPSSAQAFRTIPVPVRHEIRAEGTAPAASLRDEFAAAVHASRFEDARRAAKALLATDVGRELLDEVTFTLVEAGAAEQAGGLLLQAYPFAGRPAAERELLLQRLILLMGARRDLIAGERAVALRDPLDTPVLRSRQAAWWASVRDCGAVRAILSDGAEEYGYADWLRLGDCAEGNAVLAQQAYTRAHAMAPGGRASLALAYQAHSAGDFVTALGAWRSVGDERLTADESLRAATTALAAGEHAQAAHWLESVKTRGSALDYEYWSLVADSLTHSDPAASTAALEKAMALEPRAVDYARRARLEQDPGRQVRWLERAAELDRENGAIQAELGYAYARAGRPASAERAFAEAAAQDPDNMNLQIELGYAHWRSGRAAEAKRVLERAWQADPDRLVLAEQLVYVHQRLKQNNQARWYARKVLDAPATGTEGEPREGSLASADRRFGLQRLHEDLGRRATINLDGWSGTHVGTGTSASETGRGYNSYSQFEVDVRLGSPSIRNGSTISAYTRVVGDGGADRSPLPSANPMLGVGLRWKPLASQIIYLAAENQTALGPAGGRDVLLRVSASFLNGGGYGDDWHPSRRGWVARNLYVDGAHYLEGNRSAFTADYRTGYHHRIAGGQTVEAYGHLQFNGLQSRRLERDIRSGAGLRWNIWHGGTRHDAPPHKIALGVEFQHAFETYLQDRRGLFVTVGSRW